MNVLRECLQIPWINMHEKNLTIWFVYTDLKFQGTKINNVYFIYNVMHK